MVDFLWLMYLGLMGTTAIWFLIKGKYKSFATKLDFVISIFTWFGLFGFVTGVEMVSPLFWKAVFTLGLIWDVLFTLFFAERFAGELLSDQGEESMPLIAKWMGLIFIFPLYYGIYQYAFY